MFFSCSNLPTIVIPKSVISIGSNAFEYCANLATVRIGAGVSRIDDYAFGFCSALSAVFFFGNSPPFNSTNFHVFNADPGAVKIYYLPGTTGWTSSFAGISMVLWNPQIQTGYASFGVHSNRFGFHITGTTDIPVIVQACTNLASANWDPLQTLTLTNGLYYFSDPTWANSAAGWYRITAP
jgi:hypothetical protein